MNSLIGEHRSTWYILDVPSIPPAMPGKGITGSRNMTNACGDGMDGMIAEFEPGEEKNNQQ